MTNAGLGYGWIWKRSAVYPGNAAGFDAAS